MKLFKHYHTWYYYTKSQRIGFVLLVLIIVLFQGFFLFYNHLAKGKSYYTDTRYLEFVNEVDRLGKESRQKKDTIYPFNPNFITDFKGQQLEMTIEQLDKLFDFRNQNKYVNSSKEFQDLTKVSDEWMLKYQVYFKFPDWLQSKSRAKSATNRRGFSDIQENTIIEVKDLNTATTEDLQLIKGIGPAYSERIIRERNKLGGFVSIYQINFLNLPSDVVDQLLKYFVLKELPDIIVLKVNQASIDELKSIPYLNYYSAREIVKYRSMSGDITGKEELIKIDKFPIDKIDIISLYLDFTI